MCIRDRPETFLSNTNVSKTGGSSRFNAPQITLANVTSPFGSTGKNGTNVVVRYLMSCLFTKNNTHITYSAVVEDTSFQQKNPTMSYNEKYLYYCKLPHKVKFAISTGCLGFRKAARGEYEAGFQTATRAFQMIEEKGLLDKNIEIVMKDFGKGREAFISALNGKEGNVVRNKISRIWDKTPLKFGGVRSPKIRRL